MLIQTLKEISHDPAYIFKFTYFESFQIRLLKIMYNFGNTNRDNIVILLFQNLYKLILRICNMHE